MNSENTLTAQEQKLLHNLIGANLSSIEGSLLGGDTFYEKVRLYTDNDTIDISNSFTSNVGDSSSEKTYGKSTHTGAVLHPIPHVKKLNAVCVL